MTDQLARFAGRLVVAVFGGAFVLAIVIMAIQLFVRLQDWWREEN